MYWQYQLNVTIAMNTNAEAADTLPTVQRFPSRRSSYTGIVTKVFIVVSENGK